MKDDLQEEPVSYRIVEALEKRFGAERHFAIDARCIKDSPKAFYYFSGENGLNSNWGENKVFLQLPTHNIKLIKTWLAKAFREGQRKNCAVWVFVPRFIYSNSFYSEYLMKSKKMILIQGRMPLEDEDKKISTGCCILEFNGKVLGGPSVFTMSVNQIMEETTLIPTKNHLYFELKKRASFDAYETLSQSIKPIQINRNDVDSNEILYQLDKQGKLNFPPEQEESTARPVKAKKKHLLDDTDISEEDFLD